MSTALELNRIFQHVGGHCVIADVELTLEMGKDLLVVGPNGAGKTLLVRLMLGLDAPSAGTIRILGVDLNGLSGRRLAQLRYRLGAVFQGGALLQSLSVLENLLLPLRRSRMNKDELRRSARLAMTLLQLDGLENHLPRSLSVGQRRRVELARALIHRPSLLIWDGLSDGLDRASAREVVQLLMEQRKNWDMSMVLTDNGIDVLSADAQRVAVFSDTCIAFDGTRAELMEQAQKRLDLRYLLNTLLPFKMPRDWPREVDE